MEEIYTDTLTMAAGLAEQIIPAAGETAEAGFALSLDTVWVLLASMLVFIMQLGFAMVEAGFARAKNTVNILMKNLLDFSIGSIIYWFIGFGLMFGASWAGFIGIPQIMGYAGWQGAIPREAFLVFQTMFCATSATIVSGAMAGRTEFRAYLLYCVCICLFVYPVSGHWVWGTGWLSRLGFHDFAGSAVVHSLGGWIAMVGAWLLGPRIGKYRNGKICPIPGQSMTLAFLGVFVLWFGWFGFNPGSQLSATGEANATAISRVFLTTNLAAAAGGLVSLATTWVINKRPSLSLTLNGLLAGLVAITAGCDLVSPAGAIIIGSIAGFVMIFAVAFFDKVKIDDPVGAISVHGVCGTLGTILTGMFAVEGGLLYGGGAKMLGIQTLGAVAVACWAMVMGYIIFKTIKSTIGLRVDRRVEEEGLDLYEHGESAYN